MKKEERTYRLDRSVVGEGVLSELASDTGLLVASEGNLGVELVVAVAARTKLISLRLNEEEGRGNVHPDGPGLESVGGLEGAADVAGEHGGGETVHGVVGLVEDVGLILEATDDDDGAEDLLLDDAHLGGNISL